MTMRILMLAHRLPCPPTKGEKIRALHHLRALSRSHEVTLLSLVDDPEDLNHVALITPFTSRLETVASRRRRAQMRSLAALVDGGSMTERYFRVPALRRRVQTLLRTERWDAVFVYSSAMAQYVEGIDIPVIMDFVDMDSQKWLQYGRHRRFPWSRLYRREGLRMEAYERRVAASGSIVLVVSEPEAAQFRRLVPGTPVAIVPLVVDTDYFRPRGVAPDEPPTIVFTGVMNYFPNVDGILHFAHRIFPRIRARVPNAHFVIVGQRPTTRVRALADLPGIEVTGPVPDVRPHLGRAHVVVTPLRIAQGMQTKVLEAMAMQLPVVTTSKAYEGLDARPGRDLLVEDDPVAFADAVVHLLEQPARRADIGRAARAHVEACHSRPALAANLKTILAEVTRGTRGLPPVRQPS